MPNLLQESLMSLYIEMCFDGQLLASGTGFIVKNSENVPFLVTNRHNVTGRNQVTGQPLSSTGGIPNELWIWHVHDSRKGAWVCQREFLWDEHENQVWHEHPKWGAEADFVALRLTELNDTELFPYPLRSDHNFQIGPSDSVSVIGFPFGQSAAGFFAIWATGFVATELELNYRNLPVFLIDCRSRPGQSGSPVIYYRNSGVLNKKDGSQWNITGPTTSLIGIYSGRINRDSDLGMVWKASAIEELISSIKSSSEVR